MSRTIHGSKGPGYDWWSRRPYSGNHGSGSAPYMRWIKRRLHKTERHRARIATQIEALKNDPSERDLLAGYMPQDDPDPELTADMEALALHKWDQP